jgi:hypothetical protein
MKRVSGYKWPADVRYEAELKPLDDNGDLWAVTCGNSDRTPKGCTGDLGIIEAVCAPLAWFVRSKDPHNLTPDESASVIAQLDAWEQFKLKEIARLTEEMQATDDADELGRIIARIHPFTRDERAIRIAAERRTGAGTYWYLAYEFSGYRRLGDRFTIIKSQRRRDGRPRLSSGTATGRRDQRDSRPLMVFRGNERLALREIRGESVWPPAVIICPDCGGTPIGSPPDY